MQIFRRCILFFAFGAFMLLVGFGAGMQSTAQETSYTQRRINVPILMYHYVSPIPPDADAIRVDLTVEPEIFRTHLQYLREQGYEAISLYQLDQALTNGVEMPERPIILTFDDGYIEHYTTVFPLLKEFGFTATFFVITGKPDAGDPVYMRWDQIVEMSQAGMSMEPHTRSHRDLRGRDVDYLIYEIVGSMESLAAHTGQPARMFAYPAGFYDDDTLRVLNSSQILRAVTTQSGSWHTSDNRMEIQRLRVSGNLSISGLTQLLNSN